MRPSKPLSLGRKINAFDDIKIKDFVKWSSQMTFINLQQIGKCFYNVKNYWDKWKTLNMNTEFDISVV